MNIDFYATLTGDCVTLTTPSRLILIDCGHGPDYRAIVKASRHHGVDGLVLSHAHANHWADLRDVLGLLTPDGWVARSGTTFAPDLMRTQRSYPKYPPVELAHAVEAYLGLPPRPLPELHDDGWTLRDLNASDSGLCQVADAGDRAGVHRGCIVPVVECGGGVMVFGTDLESSQWRRLYEQGLLPRDIDLLHASNHGQEQGRMDPEVFRHLNPALVLISDADPEDNDTLAHYAALGARTLSLKESGILRLVAWGGRVEIRGRRLPGLTASPYTSPAC